MYKCICLGNNPCGWCPLILGLNKPGLPSNWGLPSKFCGLLNECGFCAKASCNDCWAAVVGIPFKLGCKLGIWVVEIPCKLGCKLGIWGNPGNWARIPGCWPF